MLHIGIDSTEEEEFAQQLDKAMASFQALKDYPLQDVPVLEKLLREESPLRSDERKPSLAQEQTLRNAPHKAEDYFAVP